MEVARYLAQAVAKAHARLVDHDARDAWLTDMRRDRQKSMEAPPWHWSSVVEPVGNHEIAYLEHCSRCAPELGQVLPADSRQLCMP